MLRLGGFLAMLLKPLDDWLINQDLPSAYHLGAEKRLGTPNFFVCIPTEFRA